MSHVTKDTRGYLWISTFNGAVRFDGNEFKNFDTNNIPLLETSAIRSILPLSDGSMYFSTESSGLLFYSNGVFTSPFKGINLPRNILATYKTPDCKLWVGTVSSGIYYIENDLVHKYEIKGYKDLRVNNFTLDSNNNLWVATDRAGVIKITKQGYEQYSKNVGLPFDLVYSVSYHNNKTYLGTSQGLFVYSKGLWTEEKHLAGYSIFQIVPDKVGNLWIGTTKGLGRLAADGGFDFISVKDGLPVQTINGITIDDESIWLATYRGGLVQLKKSSFKNLTTRNGLSYNNINCISESANGHYYIGNTMGGVDVVKEDKIVPLILKSDFENPRIKDILVEEDGTIWIASYRGLIKKTATEEKKYTKANGLLSNRLRRLYKDTDGSIWVSSRNGGINIIAKDGSVKSISKKEGLSSDFIFSLDKYSNGAVIAGSANGGLNIIHQNLSVKVINPDNIFSGVPIFNVYIENDTAMWLATNIGLYYYDHSQFYLINPQNGLAAETIFDVIEDKNGNLWMTSIKGMIKVHKKEVLKLVEGKINKIRSTLLDDSDGMVTRECTGATRSLLASDSNIWIPTISGVSILDTRSAVVTNSERPSVFIENVIIDDIPVDRYSGGFLGTDLEIKPGHRSYIFKYTTLSLGSAKKMMFKYKLEGFDKDWVYAGVERQAKYTNLPYGNYTFKVNAINNQGIWSEKAASLDLAILPFVYETIPFYIILFFVFISLIYIIYSYQTKAVSNRNKELIKLNAELDSFAYSVSHDLKAPLTSIQGLLNVARLDDTINAPIYYDKIEKSVNKLDSFIKDIIAYSKNARIDIKKEKVNIKSLVEEVIKGLSYFKAESKIKFIDEIQLDLNIKTDKTRLIFIANNLITNAIRYADFNKEEPFVKIRSEIKDKSLIFSVIDNGQGIKDEFQGKIFNIFYRANENSTGSGLGLFIVKESTAKLGGKIKLQSEYMVGTTITIVLPL